MDAVGTRIQMFWDSKFKEGNEIWGNLPADSAIRASILFEQNSAQSVLIPGIGYGRNATCFTDKGMEVTGIELSPVAITQAKNNGHSFTIHCGSVLDMPFDNSIFDGIFCYALLHLFREEERSVFLHHCNNQLAVKGLVIFTVVAIDSYLYGRGTRIDESTFELFPGIKVFFYNSEKLYTEFNRIFDVISIESMNEPIKFNPVEPDLKFLMITARKKQAEPL